MPTRSKLGPIQNTHANVNSIQNDPIAHGIRCWCFFRAEGSRSEHRRPVSAFGHIRACTAGSHRVCAKSVYMQQPQMKPMLRVRHAFVPCSNCSTCVSACASVYHVVPLGRVTQSIAACLHIRPAELAGPCSTRQVIVSITRCLTAYRSQNARDSFRRNRSSILASLAGQEREENK